MVKPILFNEEMVQAILDGRKSCTRRIMKPQPKSKLCYTIAGCESKTWGYPSKVAHEFWGEEYRLPAEITKDDLKKRWKPPCETGDILYVRETWQECCRYTVHSPMIHCKYCYKASNGSAFYGCIEECGTCNWRPSIHMPKEAARIWLKVKDVRVERLKDMTDKDALKEGAQGVKCDHAGFSVYGCTDCMNTGWLEPPILEFMGIWDSTIKKSDLDRYGWDANPWVWVIEFEQCEKPRQQKRLMEYT